MTLVLFSQGPTKHSRIGNSLVWMSKLSYWLAKANLDSFFPWGYENYQAYFSSHSSWVTKNDKAYSLYASAFDEPLSAIALARKSRAIEHEFEAANLLKPFSWDSLQISCKDGKVLYITGKLDLYSDDVMSNIRDHELVICHEPFNLACQSSSEFYGEDYSAIAPCQELLALNSKYIHSKSIGKMTAALHIRRGDYQTWNEGRYCYGDSFWLSKASDLLRRDYQPWIFSNDLSAELSGELELCGAVISNGSFEDDFVRLMFMDQVLGPPSTFTGMAVRVSKYVLGRNPGLQFFDPKYNTVEDGLV